MDCHQPRQLTSPTKPSFPFAQYKHPSPGNTKEPSKTQHPFTLQFSFTKNSAYIHSAIQLHQKLGVHPLCNSASQSQEHPMESAICRVAPLEAVLFDIDGTMCVSDPFHHRAFSELLQKLGYNDGAPITPEFGMKHMAGRSNEQIGRFLFPEWSQDQLDAFFLEKEALFARYAGEGLREVAGLTALCRWAGERGLKHAAVTNAPRRNAELMISILGLSDFFQLVVTGEDCGRSKPFPDPYLRVLALLGASPDHSVVFEDSVVGVQAGVAAGMPVIAIAEESREAKVVAAGASLVIRDYQDGKLWAALGKLDSAGASASAGAGEEASKVDGAPAPVELQL